MKIDTFKKLDAIRNEIGETRYQVATKIIENGGYVVYENGMLNKACPRTSLHTPDC